MSIEKIIIIYKINQNSSKSKKYPKCAKIRNIKIVGTIIK